MDKKILYVIIAIVLFFIIIYKTIDIYNKHRIAKIQIEFIENIFNKKRNQSLELIKTLVIRDKKQYLSLELNYLKGLEINIFRSAIIKNIQEDFFDDDTTVKISNENIAILREIANILQDKNKDVKEAIQKIENLQ